MKIKVGDVVRVKDWGRGYSTCASWFEDKLKNCLILPEYAIHYAYGDSSNYIDHQYNDINKYRVLYVDDNGDGKALITRMSNCGMDKTHLIGINALELYDSEPIEMTISEIEEKLGIRNLKVIVRD